ncbi:hypothetical protein E3T23_01225 [Cryobacterium cheniae]|uniref:Uncharacterized protein n=1 Tax=Cryobacterium cheniae TaxID=1259262 RepID=A0A4R8XXS3_9MICO|nr:hypothetical protein [Cryobacterium cheniae]TFC83910.1 hypothetical protein E3T23_01225 [Cryobacterium cheniae]
MQWWNSFVSWLTAASNQTMVFSAVVLIVSIVVASLLAALIAREAIRRLLVQNDRALKAAVIGTLVDAATEASVWNSLTPQEQVMADRAVGQADVQLRLLPIKGSGVAANWAAHQLAELKRTSATFGYQLEPALVEFRDRLVEWQEKPGRTRKIFQSDLDRWRVSKNSTEKNLLAEQDAWTAQQHHDQYAAEPAAPAPAPLQYPSETTSPSTETQRLLDDVQALEVRPTPFQS